LPGGVGKMPAVNLSPDLFQLPPHIAVVWQDDRPGTVIAVAVRIFRLVPLQLGRKCRSEDVQNPAEHLALGRAWQAGRDRQKTNRE